jgi:glutamate formiminotransferase/formiminotetrahydrofolate cyclodeaminase
MPNQIIECIPNFSEGRNMQVVDDIVAAIQSVEGITLLDRSSDSDHNRSVITFVGDMSQVGEAAFRGISKAAELIDMDKHQGAHPRMGATDVVPFVPIAGVTMDDCVTLSKQVGERVGTNLDIPVYLYEKAASKLSRRNLAKVRRGEYEGIKGEIGQLARRKPDFGPLELNSAGAVAIGARPALIAYNVYLNSGDVEVAKKIARAVRHLSGGFRFVKGAGFLVDGRAQVSMNLTDYTRTPVARVIEAIRTEAARFGLVIEESELVGLIPQAAIANAAAWYLQLPDFEDDQILENRIASLQAAGTNQSINGFLGDLASSNATPGGGSGAALAGAMSASLLAMVARLSVGKAKFKSIEAQMGKIITEADILRAELSKAVQKDSDSFAEVMAAFKLPKKSKPEQETRQLAIQKATLKATIVPLEVVEMALRALSLIPVVAELGNENAITDAGTAAALAYAAIQGAALNVHINLNALDPNKETTKIEKHLNQFTEQALEYKQKVDNFVAERGKISTG